MSEVAEDDLILEGEELQSEGPCVEEGVGRVVIPTKGKLFADDGSVNVAIIRPCVSRGKRLRGLPPIYEPGMLGRNASVFEDWHMWMGHMSQPVREALEELEERLQESVGARRLFSELGGRVVKTWFDPTFTAKYDDSAGYRPGATMGQVIPYPASKQILEADPDGLHVSIAAWPTSARVANPSWDASLKGMAVEGFRRTPRGSVDWVLRGGAGGRPVAGKLTEAEQLAVSALGNYYDPLREELDTMPDFKTMTIEQLRENLQKENPELLSKLGDLKVTEEDGGGKVTVTVPKTLTPEEVDAKLTEQREQLTEEFEEKLTEELDTKLQEGRQATIFEGIAREMIRKASLPRRWTEDLQRRYTLMPSGPGAALLAESEEVDGKTLTAEEVFKARVTEDIKHARELIAEAGGGPVVEGLGSASSQGKAKGGKRSSGAFRDFLRESGDLKDNDGKALEGDAENEAIREMVQEGIN